MTTHPSLLVERSAELLLIAEVLATAAHGTGALLVVEGAAGLGKSALLDAASHACTPCHVVLRATGNELEAGFPFGVALQLFERRVATAEPRERGALLSGAARLAAPLVAPGDAKALPGEEQMHSLIHGLYWLAANVASSGSDADTRPLAILIDDAQWADVASLQYLLYLTRRLDELPVALVITRRPGRRDAAADVLAELQRHALARTATLSPLSEEGVAAIVQCELSSQPDAGFCAACLHASGGNPFVLKELLREVRHTGLAPTAESNRQLLTMVPQSVLAAVLARLARVRESARRLAVAVAVLGDGTKLRDAVRLAELEMGEAALAYDALVEQGIVMPGERLTFSHRLIGEALMKDLPRGQLAHAHLRAAHMLDALGAPRAVVASHLLHAPPSGDPWVVEVLRTAAARQLAAGSSESASRLLQRAVDEPPAPSERPLVLAEYADAKARQGDPDAVEDLERALSDVHDPELRGGFGLQLGRLLFAEGRYDAAATTLRTALTGAQACQSPLVGQLWATLATVAAFVPSLRQLFLDRLETIGRNPGDPLPGDRVVLAHAAVHSAFAGRPIAITRDLAARAWGDGALLADETSDGDTWYLLTAALTTVGECKESVLLSAAAQDDARRRGTVFGYATSSYCLALPLHQMGRLAEARAEIDATLDARRYGWSQFVGAAIARSANLAVDMDDAGRARSDLCVLDQAAWEESPELPLLLVARGRLHMARGRPEQALADLLEAGRLAIHVFGIRWSLLVPYWRAEAALAARAMGRVDTARSLASDHLAIANEIGAPGVVGQAKRIVASVTGDDACIEVLHEAVALLAESDMHLEHAAALIDLGSALAASDRHADARCALQQGLDRAQRFGAARLVDLALRRLHRSGAKPRRMAVTGWEALTGAERHVAQLAAEGLTNREIAQALFVTTKAVEWHLGNVYQKLHIDSRKKLSAVVADAARRLAPGAGASA